MIISLCVSLKLYVTGFMYWYNKFGPKRKSKSDMFSPKTIMLLAPCQGRVVFFETVYSKNLHPTLDLVNCIGILSPKGPNVWQPETLLYLFNSGRQLSWYCFFHRFIIVKRLILFKICLLIPMLYCIFYFLFLS